MFTTHRCLNLRRCQRRIGGCQSEVSNGSADRLNAPTTYPRKCCLSGLRLPPASIETWEEYSGASWRVPLLGGSSGLRVGHAISWA